MLTLQPRGSSNVKNNPSGADYATSNFSWEMFSIVRDKKKHPAAEADRVFFGVKLV
jgi:hypothetical protein